MVGQKDGSFTTKDGIKIHYLTHGDSGSWVVLVHGYSDNAQRMWFNTGIAPEIAKHHRVVAIDNRNHGQSDKPTPGGSGRAEDVIELMDHLKIQRAHIHGYSMGGGIVGTLLGMIPGAIHHRGLWRFRHERNQPRVSRRGRGDGRCAAEGDGRRRGRHGPVPFARRCRETGGQCGGRHRGRAIDEAVSRSDEAARSRSSRSTDRSTIRTARRIGCGAKCRRFRT